MAREKKNVDVTENLPTVENVTLTITLPRYADIAVAPGRSFRLDRQKYIDDANGAAVLLRKLIYGEGRFTRDGTTKVTEGEGDAKVTRDATPDERLDLSTAKWARDFAGTLKTREGSAASDPELAELRTLTILALQKKGKKVKEIGKLPTRTEIAAALAAFEGAFEKLSKRAAAIVAERNANDIEI